MTSCIYQSLEVVFEESDEELRVVDQKFNLKLESMSFPPPHFLNCSLGSHRCLELLTTEKQTMERVQHLQREKRDYEAKRSELAAECSRIQTNLQHQMDLIAVRLSHSSICVFLIILAESG